MSNKILVISNYFPPMPGVGGRRWAKFVKYLCRMDDVKIHVISAQTKYKNLKASFAAELVDLDFEHTELPTNYPKHLEHLEYAKPSLYSKVMFRLQMAKIQKEVEGNIWDFSIFWKTHFDKTIPDIIRKGGYDKIIVSGPPFRYVVYANDLKKQFPKLEIILDCRDPWNSANDIDGAMPPERRAYEVNLEKKMLKTVDKVIAVSEFQKSLLLKTQPESAPIYVIPNGFDPEDYPVQNTEKEVATERIRIGHLGTLHQRKDYYWVPFLNAYKRLKKDNPDLYELIDIDFVGHCPDEIRNKVQALDLDIRIHGLLDPFDAFALLSKTDVAIWFKYDGSPGDFATKFGDYICMQKFMWTFSVKGAVTDFIEKEKIGKTFYRDDLNLEDSIYEAFLNLKYASERTFNPDFNPNDLSIGTLAQKLIEMVNDPITQ